MSRETRIRELVVGYLDDLIADNFEHIERAAIESDQYSENPKARATVVLAWDVATTTPHLTIRLAYSQRTTSEVKADLDLNQTDLFAEGGEG
jgi:hypothetical protein